MDMIRILKAHKHTRKIFGLRELKIIEKQIWGISLTQSEKNRLSRDIRPKLRFIRDMSKYADEFELKKGSAVKRVIDEAKERILEDSWASGVDEIILFGSAVENKLTFRSDIDIAVVFKVIDQGRATEFRKRLSAKLNEKVDLQVFNILPEIIKKDIRTKGKVLYSA